MRGSVAFLGSVAMMCALAMAEPPPDVITRYSDIPAAPVRHPALKKFVTRNAARLKERVAAVMALPEEAMLALVPTQAGLFFAGCPVKGCLNPQGRHLQWDIQDPGHLK